MPKKQTISSENKSLVSSGKRDTVTTNVWDIKGNDMGKMTLPEMFSSSISPFMLAQAARVFLANQRLGTASTKTRSEVAGTTKKMYRQKGTGRARHGDAKAPILIGGGIAHGPKPRDYRLSLSKKMRKKTLFAALASKLHEGKLKVVEGIGLIEPKTKQIVEVLNKLKIPGLEDKKNHTILLVLPEKKKNILLAGRNLSYMTICEAKLLNAYEILSHQYIVCMKDAIEVISKHFGDKVIKIGQEKRSSIDRMRQKHVVSKKQKAVSSTEKPKKSTKKIKVKELQKKKTAKRKVL